MRMAVGSLIGAALALCPGLLLAAGRNAAIRYRGCPERGAIPTLVLGRRVETRCGPWELLDARLGLDTPTEGEDRDGIACACR